MKNSGAMASMAVPTSMARMPCMGRISSSKAPSGGAAMFAIPKRVWFNPAMRERCFSGTISVVEACIAGQWNAPPAERMSIKA